MVIFRELVFRSLSTEYEMKPLWFIDFQLDRRRCKFLNAQSRSLRGTFESEINRE